MVKNTQQDSFLLKQYCIMPCHQLFRHRKSVVTFVTVAVLLVLYVHVWHDVWHDMWHDVWPGRQSQPGQHDPTWRPSWASPHRNEAGTSGITVGTERGITVNKRGNKDIRQLANNDKGVTSIERHSGKSSKKNVQRFLKTKQTKSATGDLNEMMKNLKNSDTHNKDGTETHITDRSKIASEESFHQHPSSKAFTRTAQQISLAEHPEGDSAGKIPTGVFVQNSSDVSVSKVSASVYTRQSQNSDPGRTENPEAHHLFFLKVHKAASTTVLNIIYRFALSHRLVVLLPKPENANILSEVDKNWAHNTVPLPPGAQHFDILCNHLIFDENSVRKALPRDAFFVGIVRQPFEQFVSAFWYYREVYPEKYLQNIPGKQPISVYLKNPRKWELSANGLKFTHNRMSIDFGMDPQKAHDRNYVKSYISYLNSTFHLVMVSERFDESILLLRRLLGWKVQDMVYIKNNVKKHASPYNQNFTKRERQAHKDFNMADYLLYDHFSKLLDDKIRAAGPSFQEEVRSFRVVLKTVDDYCGGQGHLQRRLRVTASFWQEEFMVTPGVCQLMTLNEMTFVDLVRQATPEIVDNGQE